VGNIFLLLVSIIFITFAFQTFNDTIMFILDIKEAFAQKGVMRPYAQLLKMGIPRTRAKMMLNGTAKTLHFRDLFVFCTYLNCTPKELLKVEIKHEGHGIENTPLKDWIKKPDINMIKEIIELTPDELEKMKDFYREMKGI
jgi:DNA-binding Xre family transcriptional regulator